MSKMHGDKDCAVWEFHTARKRFDELVHRALTDGPQYIFRRDSNGVVMVRVEEFERLSKPKRNHRSLVEFLAQSPLVDSGIKLERT